MANVFTYKDTDYHVGDMVSVQLHVSEGDKTRIQSFEGLVIKINGQGESKSFTVRKIASGAIGVERILPVNSPSIDSITKKAEGKVRRAKLYYLRNWVGKKALKVKVKDTNSSKKSQAKSAKVKADAKDTKPVAKKAAGSTGRKPSKKAATK